MADPYKSDYSAYGIKSIGNITDEALAQISVDVGLPSASYAYQQNSFRPAFKKPIDIDSYYGSIPGVSGLSGKAYNTAHNIDSTIGPTIANANKNSNLPDAVPTTGLVNGYTQDSINTLSDPNFTEWAGNYGVDLNGKTNDEIAGLKQLQTGGDKDKWWGADSWGGFGIGLGQLGLGIASFLDGTKTADVQRRLLNQRYEANKETLANMRADRKHLANVFKASR